MAFVFQEDQRHGPRMDGRTGATLNVAPYGGPHNITTTDYCNSLYYHLPMPFSTMHKRDRQTYRPRDGNIDTNRRNRLKISVVLVH